MVRLMLPPGPRIPKFVSTMMWMRDPFGLMDRCAKRFGEPYTMTLAGFAPIVVAYTPETVKEIFADDGETFAAGKFNKKLDIGDTAPAWKDLEGTDGKKHALADLKGKDVVVVVFTCNSCPEIGRAHV